MGSVKGLLLSNGRQSKCYCCSWTISSHAFYIIHPFVKYCFSHALSADYCHGCSWMGTRSSCLRLEMSERTSSGRFPANSLVSRRKSTRATKETCVALRWPSLTWSAVEGIWRPVWPLCLLNSMHGWWWFGFFRGLTTRFCPIMFLCSSDGKILVYNRGNYKSVEFSGHKQEVNCLDTKNGLIISGSRDQTTRVGSFYSNGMLCSIHLVAESMFCLYGNKIWNVLNYRITECYLW